MLVIHPDLFISLTPFDAGHIELPLSQPTEFKCIKQSRNKPLDPGCIFCYYAKYTD
jgi:hypothetical protein